MSKYHIPVIVEVECDSIDEARRATQRMIESVSFKEFSGGDEGKKPTPATMRIANDGMKAKTGQRVFLIHPEDSNADYSPEEYEAERAAKTSETNQNDEEN
jgi:hypothetical protein